MKVSDFCLEHVNVPSKSPNDLAKWYADTFDLTAEKHVVRGPGVLIAFQEGEPINRPDVLHIGFRVPNMVALEDWRSRFDRPLKVGPEFSSFQVFDPEGNCVEIYTKNT